MKLLIAALSVLVVLSVTACENQDNQDPNNNNVASDNNNGNGNNPVNQTDYSVCGVTTAPHTIEGRWQMVQAQGSFRLTTSMYIQNGTVQLVNDCDLSGNTLRATVAAPAVYDYNSFQVSHPVSDTQKIDRPNFQMSCNASLNTTKLYYTFQGNCLVLYKDNTNNNRSVFVPF